MKNKTEPREKKTRNEQRFAKNWLVLFPSLGRCLFLTIVFSLSCWSWEQYRTSIDELLFWKYKKRKTSVKMISIKKKNQRFVSVSCRTRLIAFCPFSSLFFFSSASSHSVLIIKKREHRNLFLRRTWIAENPKVFSSSIFRSRRFVIFLFLIFHSTSQSKYKTSWTCMSNDEQWAKQWH